jgi:peroxiredoxin
MRIYFSLLLLAASPALFAQDKGKFDITGRIKGFHEEKLIYLGYMKDGERVLDSCPVKNDTYHFAGDIPGVSMGILADTPLRTSIYPRNGCEIVMSPASFTITHVDSFSNGVATGSKLNSDLFAQRDAFRGVMKIVRPMYHQYDSAKAAGNEALATAIDKRVDSIYDAAKEDIYGRYIREQPHSPLALTVLERYAGATIDPGKIMPLFESLSEEARNSAEGKAFRERIASVEKTAVGKEAMDFTQNDTAGVPVKLSSFRGKYVLLDFWASWCVPCRQENPNVVKAYDRYHPKGFEVLSVSLDKEGDKDKWLKAIHEDKLTWTHVSDLQFWNNAVAKAYGIMAVPQNFLIDPQGKIVAKDLRGEALEKKLHELFPD